MTELFTLLQVSDDPFAIAMDALQRFSFKLFCRLLLDLATVAVLVRVLYYRIYRKRDLFFTFFIFNIVIFLLCFLLNKVDLSMGAAFGLFAVFGMLRYRTEDLSIKDMTYLFLVIAIGLVNAVTKIKLVPANYELLFLLGLDSMILLLAYLLESSVIFRRENVQLVTYDNMELIREKEQQRLIEDLRTRTGLDVHRVVIQKIDFTKPSVQLKVYYF